MKKTILTLIAAAVLCVTAEHSTFAQDPSGHPGPPPPRAGQDSTARPGPPPTDVEGVDLDEKYAVDLIKVGENVPDFTIGDLERNDVTFSEISKGKIVLLDFWATWCPDCRKDVPKMKELYAKYGDKVLFVGVSMDTDGDRWRSYVKENGMEWLQLSELKKWKKETVVPDSYNVGWIPSIYIIDGEGKVLLGTVMIDKAETFLEDLCK